MKRDKIIYWAATGLISLMMLFSGYNYFTNEEVKQGFTHLGFPSYFRVELGIAKILGAVLLLIPVIPTPIKDAVYGGFAIVFVSAFIAHAASGDPTGVLMAPAVFFVVLIVSFVYYHKTIAKSVA
jgi:hypothetical protein